jgi:hypothetical protein
MSELPGIGRMTWDEEMDWYVLEEMPVPVLGGQVCRIIVDGYDGDEARDDLTGAIRNFLALDPSALRAAEAHVFQYYRDCAEYWDDDDDDYPDIPTPADVWQHVRFGTEPVVKRRAYGDRGIYISLECECDWEPEHGLEIVFHNGQRVNKVGPYDGHCTNADAYDDESHEDLIYVPS